MGKPVGAMSGLGSHGQADLAEARLLKMRIAREVVQVGTALGYHIEPISGVEAQTWLHIDQVDVFEEMDGRLQSKGRVDWHSSMGQDVIKGRRTEIDHLNGLVARRGVEAGIPTPVNDATIARLHEIVARRVKPAVVNIQKVLDQVGNSA